MEVRHWMVEREYWTGVELFCKLSDSSFLKDLFRSGKSKYNEQKLLQELKGFIESDNVITQETEILDEPQESLSDKKYKNQFLLTKLQHELKQVFRQLDDNRFALERCRTDNTRKDYAFQILSLVDKKRDIYAHIDYFHENGCLPNLEQKKKSYDTPELQRLYVQVWKLRKRLEKPIEELRNKAKTEQKLRIKLARIEELKGVEE